MNHTTTNAFTVMKQQRGNRNTFNKWQSIKLHHYKIIDILRVKYMCSEKLTCQVHFNTVVKRPNSKSYRKMITNIIYSYCTPNQVQPYRLTNNIRPATPYQKSKTGRDICGRRELNIPLKVLGLHTVAGLMPVTLMAFASHAFGVNALPHRTGSPKYVNIIS